MTQSASPASTFMAPVRNSVKTKIIPPKPDRIKISEVSKKLKK